MEWISIKDKLPDNYEAVMYVAVFSANIRDIIAGYRENNKWNYKVVNCFDVTLKDEVKVTHWMHLPEYPENE